MTKALGIKSIIDKFNNKNYSSEQYSEHEQEIKI